MGRKEVETSNQSIKFQTFGTFFLSLAILGKYTETQKFKTFRSAEDHACKKLSTLSGNFPDSPETLWTVWKLNRQSGTFKNSFTLMLMFRLYLMVKFVKIRAKTFWTRKNSPVADEFFWESGK